MTKKQPPLQATSGQIIDLYFPEHRARLLDLAAFLDRVDRYSEGRSCEDFRLRALRDAVSVLNDGRGERARRMLELWSDPTEEPIKSAAGMKGALGTWPGPEGQEEPAG